MRYLIATLLLMGCFAFTACRGIEGPMTVVVVTELADTPPMQAVDNCLALKTLGLECEIIDSLELLRLQFNKPEADSGALIIFRRTNEMQVQAKIWIYEKRITPPPPPGTVAPPQDSMILDPMQQKQLSHLLYQLNRKDVDLSHSYIPEETDTELSFWRNGKAFFTNIYFPEKDKVSNLPPEAGENLLKLLNSLGVEVYPEFKMKKNEE